MSFEVKVVKADKLSDERLRVIAWTIPASASAEVIAIWPSSKKFAKAVEFFVRKDYDAEIARLIAELNAIKQTRSL